MRTDLIIIGGGPAGLLAAKTAAEQGLSVTVIEKSKNYDKILRACSMQFIRFSLDDGKTPFSFKFDKAALLKGLYQSCRTLGVNLILDALATNGTDHGSHVEISYRSASKTYSICARKLILAEGVNASMYSKFGLNQDRPHVTTALCQKYYLKDLKGIEPF